MNNSLSTIALTGIHVVTCESFSNQFDSKCLITASQIRDSNSLLHWLLKLTRRWFAASDLLPFLNIGNTLAVFQSCGTTPSCKDFINNNHSGQLISSLNRSNSHGVNWSGPPALSARISDSFFLTIFSVIIILSSRDRTGSVTGPGPGRSVCYLHLCVAHRVRMILASSI